MHCQPERLLHSRAYSEYPPRPRVRAACAGGAPPPPRATRRPAVHRSFAITRSLADHTAEQRAPSDVSSILALERIATSQLMFLQSRMLCATAFAGMACAAPAAAKKPNFVVLFVDVRTPHVLP